MLQPLWWGPGYYTTFQSGSNTKFEALGLKNDVDTNGNHRRRKGYEGEVFS